MAGVCATHNGVMFNNHNTAHYILTYEIYAVAQ
jgi:hypothetical protein